MGKLKAPIPTRMDRPVPKVTKFNHVYRYQGYYCLGFMVCQTVRYRWYQESGRRVSWVVLFRWIR